MDKKHLPSYEDSMAEKALGDLNEDQKDKLINSLVYGFRRVSEGIKNFLTVAGIVAGIGAVLILIYLFTHGFNQ